MPPIPELENGTQPPIIKLRDEYWSPGPLGNVFSPNLSGQKMSIRLAPRGAIWINKKRHGAEDTGQQQHVSCPNHQARKAPTDHQTLGPSMVGPTLEEQGHQVEPNAIHQPCGSEPHHGVAVVNTMPWLSMAVRAAGPRTINGSAPGIIAPRPVRFQSGLFVCLVSKRHTLPSRAMTLCEVPESAQACA